MFRPRTIIEIGIFALTIPALTIVAQQPAPRWQIAAGGSAKFDIASVKPDTADPESHVNSNVPLDPQDNYSPTGGLFSATNFQLPAYIMFAYKLNEAEMHAVQSQLPKWANINRYDIQAKASDNVTKDQMRLMMQSLLTDRFHLSLHHETRQVRTFALVLAKSGKLGPQLRLHRSMPPCLPAPAPPKPATEFSATVTGGFPEVCGAITPEQPSTPGRIRAGARNLTLATFASTINVGVTGIDRPVFDETGLSKNVDFVIEFTPQINGPRPPGTNPPDPTGPTFLEALKDQLGLKLVPRMASVDVLIIDHVEEPTPN